ncbi:MAG: hypothetical protein HZA14_07455 [Nitrospirae bacterium]|nr:hypothetical protein [Nitrospirota bacterium]
MPTTLTAPDTSVICPSNDGEGRSIIDIARRMSFDVRVSPQGWGAKLSKEPPETFLGLRENVVIVEIPGVEKEAELGRTHRLYIIDHHRYDGLDRINPLSSLEQFARLTGYELDRREAGVALNDRGYIYALKDAGYSEEEIRGIRRYDFEAQGYGIDDFKALSEDYSKGYAHKGRCYVVETESRKTSFLSDMHFYEFYDEETGRTRLDLLVFVTAGGRLVKAGFSGAPRVAKAMYKMAGGYCGGDEKRSMYWGKEFANGEASKEDLLKLAEDYRSCFI